MNKESSFLSDFFFNLNNSSIKYCVLRNYNLLPYSAGESDLDILINSTDAIEFTNLITNTAKTFNGKVVSYIDSDICPRICILGSDCNGWGLMVDLHYDIITYRGYTILSNKNVWLNTFQYNKIITALNPKADALIGLFKELLNNETCTEKYYLDFQKLALDKEFLDDIFKDLNKSWLTAELLKCKNINYSNQEINRLVNELNKAFPKKSVNLFKKVKKFNRLFSQPGFTIAFLGTDGSGKTTLINSINLPLNEAFHKKVFYEHMRPNFIRSIAQLTGKNKTDKVVTNPHQGKPSGFIGSFLRWLYYMFDYTFGFYFKIYRSKATTCCVWIFDRYYYDYLVDPVRARIKLPKWIIKLGQIIIPEPDIIFCLGADSKHIYNRKPELSLKEVDRQVKQLEKFCQHHKNAVWIDTSQDVSVATTIVLENLVNSMGKRFENVELS
ncbi:hypothetical protein [Maribacter sp. MAR_2009_72]|uniref:hypothetical protein n=1 Tax=Maribacter sp. MAR_2009_72 TaxID=1250050 RepID=UPI00119A26D5|nr:hypothetical protein [Maribacter sp. MAR_2009_72]TVZ16944.1 thymidylate kinase [Maribacter sp. MAR_2009_72]